jgi:hypothetical protein
MGEWNAEATGRRTVVSPAAVAAVSTQLMSARCPATTTWVGALSFAMTSVPMSAGAESSSARTVSAPAVTASIAPSCPLPASAINSPRVRAVSANRCTGRTPAAASAVTLAETVSGRGVGGDTQQLQQRQLCPARGRDRRLRIFHGSQRRSVGLRHAGVKGGFGEYHAMQVGQVAGQVVPYLQCCREGQCQIGAHTYVLTALTGKQERGTAFSRLPHTNRDIGVSQLRRRSLRQRTAQLLDEPAQTRGVRGDQPCASRVGGVEHAGTVVGNPGQALPGIERCGHGIESLPQLGFGAGADQHEFTRQRAEPLGPLRATVLLDCHVEVAAAKAE